MTTPLTKLEIAELRAGKTRALAKVKHALAINMGNITRTAKALGIGRRTLHGWLDDNDPRAIAGLEGTR
jgi:transcriptional regulator of acetoin/glycerol metabolism